MTAVTQSTKDEAKASRRQRSARGRLAYTAAVVFYIGLGVYTQRFLTWTWGPIYFVLTLEGLPRLIGRVRDVLGRSSSRGAPDPGHAAQGVAR
jgi:hypothetical protein